MLNGRRFCRRSLLHGILLAVRTLHKRRPTETAGHAGPWRSGIVLVRLYRPDLAVLTGESGQVNGL